MGIKQKMGEYSERRFKRQFPGIKQVVNDREYPFAQNVNIPLKYGENTVYLKAEEENTRRSVYTTFIVDSYHNYGFQLVYNYKYIAEKLRGKYLKSIILVLVLQGIIIFLLNSTPLSQLNPLIHTLIVFVLGIGMIYYLQTKAIASLGISAYKIEVRAVAK